MSTATAQLLEAFERLVPEEQREFSAAIVHRAAQLDYGDIADEELTAAAARMFALIDEEEDAQTRESTGENGATVPLDKPWMALRGSANFVGEPFAPVVSERCLSRVVRPV